MRNALDLIRVYGVDGARARVVDPVERELIDTAARFYDTEPTVGVTYSGFCVISLPHRRLATNSEVWERRVPHHPCSLTIEPGSLTYNGQKHEFGVPYGAAGRLILLWLQTEALKTDTRVVRLGSSMYSWMRMMGTHAGGQNYKSIREQAMRIAACRLQFVWTGEAHGRSAVRFKKDAIVEEGMLFGDLVHDEDPRQPRLWEDTVVLSRTFYEELKKHPVPIKLNAVQTIFRSSLAIDVYIWLAYRLRALEQKTHVGWASLRDQFGPQYSRIRDFKDPFTKALQMAVCVYEEAKVDLDDRGLILFPSPPAVPERRLRQVLLPKSA
jgi:hypothetical protein